MKIFAIIVAAGNGERFCNSENKMFVPLFEKPLLSYTLDIISEKYIKYLPE
jgi:2-C-methyl-D-erythritol 4-phosphate cytidylyltransferase